MNQRIEELLERYWSAESSLAEEVELKELLSKSPGYEDEKRLFDSLRELAGNEPLRVYIPKTKTRMLKYSWAKYAAAVALIAGSLSVWRVYEHRQAEERAYQEVMQAFTLIHTNFMKGQEQMQVMEDLKYLNTTNHLFGNPHGK